MLRREEREEYVEEQGSFYRSSGPFKWQENWRAPKRPPMLIFSQSHRIKIPRFYSATLAILFSIGEKSNNFVFGVD